MIDIILSIYSALILIGCALAIQRMIELNSNRRKPKRMLMKTKINGYRKMIEDRLNEPCVTNNFCKEYSTSKEHEEFMARIDEENMELINKISNRLK